MRTFRSRDRFASDAVLRRVLHIYLRDAVEGFRPEFMAKTEAANLSEPIRMAVLAGI